MFSGLPGNVVRLKDSEEKCYGASDLEGYAPEEECGAQATHRVQGETDSFGAEYEYLCTLCFRKDQARMKHQADTLTGICESCNKEQKLREMSYVRPWDEPSIVRHWCSSCCREEHKEIQKEADYHGW